MPPQRRRCIVTTKQKPVKKYVVKLSAEERERLDTLIHTGKRPARQVLSSTFSIFHPLGRQVITQKISSWAMKRSASSIDRTVRPNGPVEAHRSFQSDQ